MRRYASAANFMWTGAALALSLETDEDLVSMTQNDPPEGRRNVSAPGMKLVLLFAALVTLMWIALLGWGLLNMTKLIAAWLS